MIRNLEKIFKNKVIKSEEFNLKESRCYNISVSIGHHQDIESLFCISLNFYWRSNDTRLQLLYVFMMVY